jgi:hypothetical protein
MKNPDLICTYAFWHNPYTLTLNSIQKKKEGNRTEATWDLGDERS